MNKITFTSIGIVESPFNERVNVPIQASKAQGVEGKIILNPELAEGLSGLEYFSHVILLYHFHLSEGYKLKVKPFLDKNEHGLFATRAPKRPNQIGISIVKIKRIENNILHISDVDIVNGTPLLDIKPYVPDFDTRINVKTGWYSQTSEKRDKADTRFVY